MRKPENTAVFTTLSDLPHGSVVRVVVQGVAPQTSAPARILDPKDFETAVDYRAALIQQHRAGSQASKALVEREALERGLKATPASTLNAVTVEGEPAQVVDLLTSIEFETAVLERSMSLGPRSRSL